MDSRPETNGDGGGVKPQANVRKEEETTPPAPAALQAKASTLKEMVQANIEAGYDLLKELCSLSEDGTGELTHSQTGSCSAGWHLLILP